MTAFFAPERLDGDGFTLRCYEPGDGPAMVEAKSSSYAHLSPWMPWASEEEVVEDNEVLARRFRAHWLTGEDFVAGIWAPDGQRLLGGTGFHPRGRGLEEGTAEIGMWIRVEEAGRGLGTRVLAAMLGWGVTDWPWERLEWRCDSRNVASARTAEKAGMRLEGTLRGERAEVGEGRRDTRLYALIRSDLTG